MRKVGLWCKDHKAIIYNSRRTTRWINGDVAVHLLIGQAMSDHRTGHPEQDSLMVFKHLPLCCRIADEELACILDRSTTEGNRPRFSMSSLWGK